jgi:IS5 family transposase
LNFRHLLEEHNIADEMFEGVNLFLQDFGLMVRQGTIVDATIIDAPSSTKNAQGKRDPEMHQTKKGNNYFFGMKAHIGVDLHTGLVHTVVGTAANVNDVTQAGNLLHGEEELVFGDAGYQGADKREENQGRAVQWFIAMRPSKIEQMKRGLAKAQTELEYMKASLRAKVEHPFRVIKRQFGYTKVRYRGLSKNTAQLKTLFALSNLWMARRQILQAMG